MEHTLQVKILKELMRQLDEGENVDAGVQYKMPTTGYVCPEQAKREQQEFFQNHPQLIGLSGDLPEPGSYFTMEDTGTPILATRDKDGEFHAFLNACRHRSVKVATEERGKKSIFVCPFHNWSYANTGNLLAIPNEDHFGEIDKSCHGLLELPAIEREGLLWVHPRVDGKLDVDQLLGEALATELALYPIANQTFVGSKTIDMNLNWKLANDTFGETYHFGKLHKNTLGQIYYGNNLHFTLFGRHHRFITASRGIDAMRDMPEDQWQISRGTFVMYHLFPNVQFIGPDTSTLIRIYPHKTVLAARLRRSVFTILKRPSSSLRNKRQSKISIRARSTKTTAKIAPPVLRHLLRFFTAPSRRKTISWVKCSSGLLKMAN